MEYRKKLIEVSLPLEDINRESAREKSIRHGHPSTLHLWWARRPLAAARAVLFAQLVDDPSAHPDLFPTEEAQRIERERLHQLIRRLVKWENVTDEGLMREAHTEILKSTDCRPPAVLDPFAGGGTIPLEAQRLGLEARASDLNPVAVLINKALIEIPPLFAGRPPVFPGAADEKLGEWPRATGLAEDVRRYGAWMRERAVERIGHLYPKATLSDGSEATVIAWIWARTVTCYNPGCGIEMPLVRSWWLGKKKGKEAYVVPEVVDDDSAPSGRRVTFTIGHDPANAPTGDTERTIGRTGAKCIACGTAVDLKYVRSEGRAGRLGARLLSVVAAGQKQRIYLAPSDLQESASLVAPPANVPPGRIADNPRWFSPPAFGMTEFSDLFTKRQLTALTTLSDLVSEAREEAFKHAVVSGMDDGARLADGGSGASAYADAIATYLGIAVSTVADDLSTIVTWRSSHGTGATRSTFARQAIPMTWDFAEANPLSGTSGDLENTAPGIAIALDRLAPGVQGRAEQADASALEARNRAISTDPPYYDNIGYSDLSDYFYVWLRRTLRGVFPDLLATLAVPKDAELVANPYRHRGKGAAEAFFEEGFERVFKRAREQAVENFPITVYYAFKQHELETEGVASTGWATMLEGMIRSGWAVTATWPIRSERAGRMNAIGANALASSIVLALRPRLSTAGSTNRRGFVNALKAELPSALAEMRQGAIAPVDFAQATIGPGMAVFSRYSEVIEADGTVMTVKTALALINQVLDEVLSEHDGDLDADTRFCITWYTQFGWTRRPYGDAEGLARPYGISVAGIARGGVLTAREGEVALTRPSNLSASWNPVVDDRISLWEVACQVARALDEFGAERAAALLAAACRRPEIEADAVQALALRLYRLADSKKNAEDAGLFNVLGTEWSTLTAAASKLPTGGAEPDLTLDLDL